MSAGRLGVEVDQATLAASPHFEKAYTEGEQTVRAGGFSTNNLKSALDEAATVPGRQWKGGQFPPWANISTPKGLQTHLKGFIDATEASVILRVDKGNHWIVVDSVLDDGRIAIRDPRNAVCTTVTAEQLSAMNPTGEAVFSFKKRP